MDESSTLKTVIDGLSLADASNVKEDLKLGGITPNSVLNSEIYRTIIVTGITPEDFINCNEQYAAVEFNFDEIMADFAIHCKDFYEDLSLVTPSKALEFSAKILFEIGPYIRNEKKYQGNKAIRFRFLYPTRNNDGKECLLSYSVIVSLRDNVYNRNYNNNKVMVMTFKQANILAMVTFNKAIALVYTRDQSMLMTPLCRTVYARDSVRDMATELNIGEVDVLRMINSSTATGGQHLLESDMACAIVSMIAKTKRVANRDVRNQMITKIIKQFEAKHKVYDSNRFYIFAKYALGGVPQGMDSATLIENFSNIPTQEINLRARVLAQKQSEVKVVFTGLGNVQDGNQETSSATNAGISTPGEYI